MDFSTGIVKNQNKSEGKTKTKFSFFKKCLPAPKKGLENAVILHVHGGGFVAMSSGSHQTYTRIWANELEGVPIFSVDYRLAPGHTFPAAINDVWQVYYWICEHAETFLGIKPEKIILVGDSAGGNLVAALTLLSIQRKYRKPDGLILAYPALNLSKQSFTPSLLLSIDDPLLPLHFWTMCQNSYIGDYSKTPQCDPAT